MFQLRIAPVCCVTLEISPTGAVSAALDVTFRLQVYWLRIVSTMGIFNTG